MKWDAQRDLAANLLRLGHVVEKTEWSELRGGMVPAKAKRRMLDYARELTDRCHYNAGWHDAKQGVELEDYRSTSTLNSEVQRMIEAIERFGRARRKPGQPKKTPKLSKAQMAILDKHIRDPKRRGLEHFVTAAMHDGKISDAQEVGTATKSLERARDRAIEDGSLDPKYRRSGRIDPSELSMEEYAEWYKAGHPVFRVKPKATTKKTVKQKKAASKK